MRLVLKSVDAVKETALLSVGGCHSVCPGEQKAGEEDYKLFSCLAVDLGHLISSFPALGLGFTSLTVLIFWPLGSD